MKNTITPFNLLNLSKRYETTIWAQRDQERVGYLARRMSLLEKEEKELIIKLTDQFCYIDYLKIPIYIGKAFEKFLNSNNQCNNIIIPPLRSPFVGDSIIDTAGRSLTKKIKSADCYYTTFKNYFIRSHYPKHIHFHFCDTPEDIKQNFQESCKIALIDDFIGSGETAVTNINDYLSYLQGEGINVSASQLSPIVIIAMKMGVDYIYSHIGVSSYHSFLKQKGITENPELNTENNVKLMKSIEAKVLHKLNGKFSFGYKASESLVSIMEKSPNNTFPFYWYKGKGGELEPIFRRDI